MTMTPRLKKTLAYWHETYGTESVAYNRAFWNPFLVERDVNRLVAIECLALIRVPGEHFTHRQITVTGLAMLAKES